MGYRVIDHTGQDNNVPPTSTPLGRAEFRFFRVAGAAVLSSAIATLVNVLGVYEFNAPEAVLYQSTGVAFLVALDKYLRDKGVY